jgi:hypothetical protein
MAYKDLNDLYQQVLGRPVDPLGQQYWRTLDVNDENSIEMFKKAAAPELAQTGYKPPVAGQTPAAQAGPAPNLAPTQYKNAGEVYRGVLGHDAVNKEDEAKWNSFFGDSIDQNDLSGFMSAAAPELAQTGYKAPSPGQTTVNPTQPNTQPTGSTGKGGAPSTTPPANPAWNSVWNPQYQTYNQPQNQPQNGVNNQQMGSSGKGGKNGPSGQSTQPQGYQGASTNSATSGQPQMGQPNMYPNTIGMGDNSRNTTANTGGKGKGV